MLSIFKLTEKDVEQEFTSNRYCKRVKKWWREKDSNLRRLSHQIYNLVPLATREPLHIFLLFTAHNIGLLCFLHFNLLIEMVEGEGFEPSKAEPSDLQSDPFGHSGTPPHISFYKLCANGGGRRIRTFEG